jgi:hypothetical protein
MRHDWVVNRKNEIRRLAKLYQNKKAAFRELVTNSLDAYEKKDLMLLKKHGITSNFKKEIQLLIPEQTEEGRKICKFGCLDFATGIENMQEFARLFESSKEGEIETAGEFGIGRIACFGLTKEINGTLEYITNNGDVERNLTVDTGGFDDDDNPVSSNNGRLKRQGCCVYVKNVDMDMMPSPKEVAKYISGVFGLKILRDDRTQIYVNKELVTINKELETFKKIYMLSESPTIRIEGNIQNYQSGTGSLWLYKKNIRIGNTTKDLGLDYRIKGWINCDQFNLTPDRDNVMEDQVLEQIKAALENYLEKGNYRKIEKDGEDQISPLKSKKLIDKMTGLLDSLFSNNSFKDRFAMPEIITQEEQEVEVDIWHNPEIVESLEKAKQSAGIDEPAITGGSGGEKGKQTEGFKTDGHKHHITPGAGTGIHTNSTIESKGEISTISTPAVSTTRTPLDSVFWQGNEQALKQKQKVMVDVSHPGGFEFVQIPYGDSRPPIFIKGSRIILNTSNRIFKACLQHELGMTTIYSLALAHLFKDYNEVDSDLRDNYVYDIMIHNLKVLGYLK